MLRSIHSSTTHATNHNLGGFGSQWDPGDPLGVGYTVSTQALRLYLVQLLEEVLREHGSVTRPIWVMLWCSAQRSAGWFAAMKASSEGPRCSYTPSQMTVSQKRAASRLCWGRQVERARAWQRRLKCSAECLRKGRASPSAALDECAETSCSERRGHVYSSVWALVLVVSALACRRRRRAEPSCCVSVSSFYCLDTCSHAYRVRITNADNTVLDREVP